MTDTALEHLRNAKGAYRKAITEAAIRAIRAWQDTGDAERAMQRLARDIHDCDARDKRAADMQDEQRKGTA